MIEFAIIHRERSETGKQVTLLAGEYSAVRSSPWVIFQGGYTSRKKAEREMRDFIRGDVRAGGNAKNWKVVQLLEPVPGEEGYKGTQKAP